MFIAPSYITTVFDLHLFSHQRQLHLPSPNKKVPLYGDGAYAPSPYNGQLGKVQQGGPETFLVATGSGNRSVPSIMAYPMYSTIYNEDCHRYLKVATPF
jgi:hypothetical protein